MNLPTTVEEAAKVLDDVVHDWAKKIDTEKLNMGHWEECILGQLYGDWDDGGIAIFGKQVWNDNSNSMPDLFAGNKEEWLNEIQKRLEKTVNDFTWAMLQMRNGLTVKRKGFNWAMSLDDGGQLYVEYISNPKKEKSSIGQAHINAKDWEVYTPKTYLKDLTTGQKFKFVNDDDVCLKVYCPSNPNSYIVVKTSYLLRPQSGEAVVKLVEEK